MSTYQSTPQFGHDLPQSTGILVVNLGTPQAPTTAAVRQFLRAFLSDPRVVEFPRFLWWLILNLFVLRFRPRRAALAYRKIWTDRGSPLLLHSRDIATKLQSRLSSQAGGPVFVELAMNYSEPSIDAAIDRLLANGARRVLTLPLYPQYSGTTTASVFDAIARKFGKLRWIPESRFINDYHDAPGYINALASSIRADWEMHGRGDKLLLSFHGLPKNMPLNGDPYHLQCQETARLLAAKLNLAADDWLISFQSRVGREEWLRPYTDDVVVSLGKQGVTRLDVVCPGFAADCLETLEEIAMQYAGLFVESGGEALHYIPALNATDHHIDFLAALTAQHMAGWDTA